MARTNTIIVTSLITILAALLFAMTVSVRPAYAQPPSIEPQIVAGCVDPEQGHPIPCNNDEPGDEPGVDIPEDDCPVICVPGNECPEDANECDDDLREFTCEDVGYAIDNGLLVSEAAWNWYHENCVPDDDCPVVCIPGNECPEDANECDDDEPEYTCDEVGYAIDNGLLVSEGAWNWYHENCAPDDDCPVTCVPGNECPENANECDDDEPECEDGRDCGDVTPECDLRCRTPRPPETGTDTAAGAANNGNLLGFASVILLASGSAFAGSLLLRRRS